MSFLFGRPPPPTCETEAAAANRHAAVMNQLSTLLKAVNALLQSQATQTTILGKIMSDTDDLIQAVTGLTTSVANLSTQQLAAVAAIEAELQTIANANTGNSPAIAQAVTNIRSQTSAIDTAATALQTEAAKVTPPTT